MTLSSNDFLKIRKLLERQIQPVHQKLAKMEVRLSGIDRRLNGIDNRLDGIDNRLSKVEGRLTKVEGRLTNVENRLNSVDSRVKELEAKVETGFSAVNKRLDKIEVWIPVGNTDLVPPILKKKSSIGHPPLIT